MSLPYRSSVCHPLDSASARARMLRAALRLRLLMGIDVGVLNFQVVEARL
jgi:hypothetical protein